MTTRLLYLDAPAADAMSATVLSSHEDERGRFVTLDQTVFYPQGGGQPGDTGTLTAGATTVNVMSTRFADGVVLHYVDGEVPVGAAVSGTIDREVRDRNSRAHSAGHLLDVVVESQFPDWLPDRGHHFPGECFVSYKGDKPEDPGNFIEKSNRLLAELIASDISISDSMATLAEIRETCSYVPPNMPEDKPLRLVTIGDNTPCPCGGTHVRRLSELGSVVIRKIKAKKDLIKISYDVQ